MQRICKPLPTLLVLATLSAAVFAHAQTITTFDPPNSTATFAVTINLSGQIAGTYIDGSAVSPQVEQKGFIRERDGTFKTFVPTAVEGTQTVELRSWVSDISLTGEVVGTCLDPYPITSCGFLRHKDGTVIRFGGAPSPSAPMLMSQAAVLNSPLLCDDYRCIDGTGAFGINALGQITGVFGNTSYSGFLRQKDGITIDFTAAPGNLVTSPRAINLFAQITGMSRAPFPDRGFLRQPNGTIVLFDPPTSTVTRPQSINLFGQIVGYFKDSSGLQYGFLRQPSGSIVTFDPQGSTGTQAESINFWGEIAGFYVTADGKSHGFLRRANGNFDVFDVPGASGSGTFPREINDLGVIAGFYEDASSVVHGFIRTRN